MANKRLTAVLVVLGLVAVMFAAGASAQTVSTWRGTTSNDWFIPGNWVGGVPTAADANATFNATPGVNFAPSLAGGTGTAQLDALLFTGSGSGYSIQDGALTVVTRIRQASAGTNTIGSQLILGAGTGYGITVASGTLSLTNTANSMGGRVLRVQTGGVLSAVNNSAGTASSLGNAGIELAGGTLQLQGQSIGNALGLAAAFYANNTNDALHTLTGAYQVLANRTFTGSGGLLATTPTYQGLMNAQWNQYDVALMFPGSGISSDQNNGTRNNYMILWTGTYTAPTTGNYSFWGSSDDVCSLWMDTNQNGAFDAGERIGNQAWDTGGGTVSLTAGQSYNVGFTTREGGGGDWTHFSMQLPGATGPVDLMQAGTNQGTWTHLAMAGATTGYGNNVSVLSNSTIGVNGSGNVALGALSIASGTTVGLDGGVSFTSGTITGTGDRTATIWAKTAGTTSSVSAMNTIGTGVTSTLLNIQGPGAVSLADVPGNTIDATTTLRVSNGGQMIIAGDNNANSIRTATGGAAALVLDSGRLFVQAYSAPSEGLKAGSLAGAWDTATANPGNFGQVDGAVGALRTCAASDAEWLAAHGVGGGSGKDNTTLVYTGQIHLTGGQQYSFAGNCDDSERLVINNTTVFDDASGWNSVDTGSITVPSTGWYAFELRLGNGTGGYGYSGQDGQPSTFGFGMKTGAATTNWVDYTYPQETLGDGTATLFRAMATAPYVDLTGSPLSVSGASVIDGENNLSLGDMTVTAPDSSLSIMPTRAASYARFMSTTLPVGNFTFNTTGTTYPGIYLGQPGSRIIKTGPGYLLFDSWVMVGNDVGTIVDIQNGWVGVQGQGGTGAILPNMRTLPNAAFVIDGGGLVVTGKAAGTVNFPNTITVVGAGGSLEARPVFTDPSSPDASSGTAVVVTIPVTKPISIDGTALTMRTEGSYKILMNSNLGGAGNLIKTGNGNVELKLVNYSGSTTVQAGTLLVDDSIVSGETSGITVNGGTFQNVSTLYTGPVNVASGATFRSQGVASLNNLASAGSSTFNSDLTIRAAGISVTAGTTSVTGNTTATGQTISLTGGVTTTTGTVNAGALMIQGGRLDATGTLTVPWANRNDSSNFTLNNHGILSLKAAGTSAGLPNFTVGDGTSAGSGWLNIAVAQADIPLVTVTANSLVDGDTSSLQTAGLIKGPATAVPGVTKLILNQGAVFGGSAAPTTDDMGDVRVQFGIVGGAGMQAGINILGNDTTTNADIYSGAVYGIWSRNNFQDVNSNTREFFGTLQEGTAGAGLEINVGGENVLMTSNTKLTTSNLVTGAHYFGAGKLMMNSAPADGANGTWTVLTRDGTSATINQDVLTLGANAIPGGKIVKVTNGRISPTAAGFMAAGNSDLIVGAGSTLNLQSYQPTGGTFDILAGGMVWIADQTNRMTNGTWHWTGGASQPNTGAGRSIVPGAMLAFDTQNFNPATIPNWPTNVQFMLTNWDNTRQWPQGFPVSDGAIITGFRNNNSSIRDGIGIIAASGATAGGTVGFAAPQDPGNSGTGNLWDIGRVMEIDDPVNLAVSGGGALNVVIGSQNRMDALAGDWDFSRFTMPMSGRINPRATFIANDVHVQSGTLDFYIDQDDTGGGTVATKQLHVNDIYTWGGYRPNDPDGLTWHNGANLAIRRVDNFNVGGRSIAGSIYANGFFLYIGDETRSFAASLAVDPTDPAFATTGFANQIVLGSGSAMQYSPRGANPGTNAANWGPKLYQSGWLETDQKGFVFRTPLRIKADQGNSRLGWNVRAGLEWEWTGGYANDARYNQVYFPNVAMEQGAMLSAGPDYNGGYPTFSLTLEGDALTTRRFNGKGIGYGGQPFTDNGSNFALNTVFSNGTALNPIDRVLTIGEVGQGGGWDTGNTFQQDVYGLVGDARGKVTLNAANVNLMVYYGGLVADTVGDNGWGTPASGHGNSAVNLGGGSEFQLTVEESTNAATANVNKYMGTVTVMNTGHPAFNNNYQLDARLTGQRWGNDNAGLSTAIWDHVVLNDGAWVWPDCNGVNNTVINNLELVGATGTVITHEDDWGNSIVNVTGTGPGSHRLAFLGRRNFIITGDITNATLAPNFFEDRQLEIYTGQQVGSAPWGATGNFELGSATLPNPYNNNTPENVDGDMRFRVDDSATGAPQAVNNYLGSITVKPGPNGAAGGQDGLIRVRRTENGPDLPVSGLVKVGKLIIEGGAVAYPVMDDGIVLSFGEVNVPSGEGRLYDNYNNTPLVLGGITGAGIMVADSAWDIRVTGNVTGGVRNDFNRNGAARLIISAGTQFNAHDVIFDGGGLTGGIRFEPGTTFNVGKAVFNGGAAEFWAGQALTMQEADFNVPTALGSGRVQIGTAKFAANQNLDIVNLALGVGELSASAKVNTSKAIGTTSWTVAGTDNAELALTGHNPIDTVQSLTLGGGKMVLRMDGDAQVGAVSAAAVTINHTSSGNPSVLDLDRQTSAGGTGKTLTFGPLTMGGGAVNVVTGHGYNVAFGNVMVSNDPVTGGTSSAMTLVSDGTNATFGAVSFADNQSFTITGNNSVVRMGALTGGPAATMDFSGGTLHLASSSTWFGHAYVDYQNGVLAVDSDLSDFYHNGPITVTVGSGTTEVAYEAPAGATHTLAGVETWSLKLSSSMKGITGPWGAQMGDLGNPANGGLGGTLILNADVDNSFRQTDGMGGSETRVLRMGTTDYAYGQFASPAIMATRQNAIFAAPIELAQMTTLGDGITIAGGKDFTLGGEISGTGALTKVGAETVTLSGANSFQGNTLISNGTLVMGNAQAFGSTTAGNVVTVDGYNSTLAINAPANFGPGGYSLVLNDGATVEVLADGVNLGAVPQIGPTNTLKLSMHSGTAPTSPVLGTTILNTTSLDSTYVLGLSGTILANETLTTVAAVADMGNTNFQIASGKQITLLPSAAFTLNASRTWDISSGTDPTAGTLAAMGDITAAADVVLTKTGPGTLILGGATRLPHLVNSGGVVRVSGAAPQNVVVNVGSLYTVDHPVAVAGLLFSEVDATLSGGVVALSENVADDKTIDFHTNNSTLSLGAYQGTQTFGGTLLPGNKFRFGGGDGTLKITSPLSAGKDAEFGWAAPGNNPLSMGMTIVAAATNLNGAVDIYQPVQITDAGAFAHATAVNVQTGGMLDLGDLLDPGPTADHAAILGNITMLGGSLSNNDNGTWGTNNGNGLLWYDCDAVFKLSDQPYIFGSNFPGTTTIWSGLSHTGGLIKVGSSTIEVWPQSYKGPTIVQAGTMVADVTTSFGNSQDIRVWPNATLVVKDTDSVNGDFYAQVTLGGTLETRANMFLHAPDIAHTAMVLNGGSPSINVRGASTLSLGQINDMGTTVTLTKQGPGTLALTELMANNTLTSATSLRIEEGTVIASNNTAGTQNTLGTAQVVMAGGELFVNVIHDAYANGLQAAAIRNGDNWRQDLTGVAYQAPVNHGFSVDTARNTGPTDRVLSLTKGEEVVFNRSIDLNGDAAYAATWPNYAAWVQANAPNQNPWDNITTMFSGRFVAPATGAYNFEWHNDDYGTGFIDLNHDGIFTADEMMGGINWNHNSGDAPLFNLNQGEAYNVVMMGGEWGGGQNTQFWINGSGGAAAVGRQIVDPSAAGQAGWWQYFTKGPIPGYGNNVTLERSSTISVEQNANVNFGVLTVMGGANAASATTLTTNGTVNFTGVQTGSAGFVAFNTALAGTKVQLGQINDNGLATTLVKKGPAELVLHPMSGATMTNTNFRLEAGTMTVETDATGNGLGGRPVELAADGTKLRLVGISTLPAPVRYYSFDDPTNVAKDNSGNAAAGILYSGATYAAGGEHGGALYLPNRTSEMFTQYGGVPLSGSYTLSAWFAGMDGQSTGDWRTLFRGWANDHQIMLQQNSDLLGWYQNANNAGFQAAIAPNGDQVHTAALAGSPSWNQITVVGNGGNSYFYINGAYVGVAPGQSATDVFTIGNGQGWTQRFAQYLDDVVLYGQALSPGQVTALYTGGVNGVVMRDIGSDIAVRANAEVEVTGGALMGKAAIDSGKTLSVTGGNVLRLAGTTVGTPGTDTSTIGINTAAAMTVYAGAFTGDTRGTTLVKTGAGALIFDELNIPTTDLNTLVDIQNGTVGVLLFGKYNPDATALPNATLQIGGGSSLVMSLGSSDNANFNNTINVVGTGGKLMYAQYGEKAVAGPMTITRPTGTAIPAGASLEIGVANGYILNNTGPITGDGNVVIRSGGLMNFNDVTIGGLAISGGTQVNLNGRLTTATPAGFSLTNNGMLIVKTADGLAGMPAGFVVGAGGNQGAWLKLEAAQNSLAGVVVQGGSAITGNTTGLTIAGQGNGSASIVLANNAIFAGLADVGTDPTVAQLGSGVRLQAAMIGGETNRVIEVSASGGAAPYTNAIYGPWSRTDPLDPATVRQFTGTINDVDGGGIGINLNGASTVLDSTATMNSSYGVGIYGQGQVSIPTLIGGSATNYARLGVFATRNTDSVTLGAGTIPAGTTYSVGNAVVVLAGGGAVLPAHTSGLTLMNGGTLSAAGLSLDHGTFNVEAGGMVWVGADQGTFNKPNTDVTWNWQKGLPQVAASGARSITPGAMLAFHTSNVNQTLQKWPTNVEFVFAEEGACRQWGGWWGTGPLANADTVLKVSDGAILAGRFNGNSAIEDGHGVRAAVGGHVGDTIGIAVPYDMTNPTNWDNRGFWLMDTIDLRLPGQSAAYLAGDRTQALNVVIGSATPMETMVSDWDYTRVNVAMSGQVRTQANFIANDVHVQSGRFDVYTDQDPYNGTVQCDTTDDGLAKRFLVNNIYTWGGYRPDDASGYWHGGSTVTLRRIDNLNAPLVAGDTTPLHSIAGSIYSRGGLLQIYADTDELTLALENKYIDRTDPANPVVLSGPQYRLAEQIVIGSNSRIELMPRGSAAAAEPKPWNAAQTVFYIREPLVIEKDNGDWRYGYNVQAHREGPGNPLPGNVNNEVYLSNVILEDGATLSTKYGNADSIGINLTLQGTGTTAFRPGGSLNKNGQAYLDGGNQWSDVMNVVSSGPSTWIIGETGMQDTCHNIYGQIGSAAGPVTARIIAGRMDWYGGSIAAGSVVDFRGVKFTPGYTDGYMEMWGGVEGGVSMADAGGKILIGSDEDIRVQIDGTLDAGGKSRVNKVLGQIEVVSDGDITTRDARLGAGRVWNGACRVVANYKNVVIDNNAAVEFQDWDNANIFADVKSNAGDKGIVWHYTDTNRFYYGDIGSPTDTGAVRFIGNRAARFYGNVYGELIWDISGVYWENNADNGQGGTGANLPSVMQFPDVNVVPLYSGLTATTPADVGYAGFKLAGGTLNMAQSTVTVTNPFANGTDIGTGTLKTSGSGTIIVAGGTAAIPNITDLVVAGGTMRLQTDIADTWPQQVTVSGAGAGTLQVGPVTTDGSVTGMAQTFQKPLVFKNGTTPSLTILGLGGYTAAFPGVQVQATAGAASLTSQIPNLNIGPVNIAAGSSLKIAGSAKMSTLTGPVGSGFGVGPSPNSDVTITETAANFHGLTTIEAGTLNLSGSSLAYNGTMRSQGLVHVTAGASADLSNTVITSTPGVTVTPTGMDIGGPGRAGSWSFDAGTGAYTVAGSGGDIWGTNDQFYYLSAPLAAGTATIMQARVLSLHDVDGDDGAMDGWTKAGLMIRDDSAANAAHGFIAVTKSNNDSQQRRPVTGWDCNAGWTDGQGNNAQNGSTAPYWLKLVYDGTNQFTGYTAPDNAGTPGAWAAITTWTVNLTGDNLLGLAVTSHNNGRLTSAVFDNFSGFGTTAAGAITVDDGASLKVGGFTNHAVVTVGANSKLELTGAQWSDTITLALDSTTELKLGAAGLIVHNGDLATIQSEIDGNIITSSLLAQDINHEWRLAAGMTADGVMVKVTILGDVNMDGTVTLADQTLLEDNFGVTTKGWTAGDFNHDGTVDWMDYLTLKQYYGRTFTGTPAVPEPATLGLLAFGLGGLLLKRRNRK